jgi:PTS system nitrogen regulatory IIA component
MMNLEAIFPVERAHCNVSTPNKLQLLTLAASKAATHDASERDIRRVLEQRESLGSTGIGGGIAVPHAACAGFDEPYGVIIKLSKPIDFEAIDGLPVDLIFVLLFGEDRRAQYLQVLARIARMAQGGGMLEAMRRSRVSSELHAAFLAFGE